jgi:phage terminase Nu1 subunit (DNA packaging protein)
MRLIKKELAKRLNVSERALTSWQDEGMPVLEHGSRGQPNAYDLGAVLRWVKATRDPLRTRIPIAELERELGLHQERADVWTDAHRAALVRAIARARLEWLKDYEAWHAPEGELYDACDLADCAERFIELLAQQLERIDARAAALVREILIARADRAQSLAEAIDWALAAFPDPQQPGEAKK